MDYGHWVVNTDFDPLLHFGAVYMIKNKINGMLYIGKKNFRHKSGKDNNWRYYMSSCKPLLKDINLYGKENFVFTILELAYTNFELTNLEIYHQTIADVLWSLLPNGTKQYYNTCIHGVGFNSTGQSRSKEHRLSISNHQKIRDREGTPCTDIRKLRIKVALSGQCRTSATKDAMSKDRKGKPQTIARLQAVNSQKDITMYNWHNSDVGNVVCSKWDLLDKHPQLTKIGLGHVIHGYQRTHKGWSILR